MTLIDTIVVSELGTTILGALGAMTVVINIMQMSIQTIFPILFKVDEICNIYLSIRLIGFIQNSIVTVLSGQQRTIGNQKVILNLRIFAVILNLILDFLATN